MKNSLSLLCAFFCLTTLANDILTITPPPSVKEGALESDDLIFLFQEQAGMVLVNSVNVDISDPGVYRCSNLWPNADLSLLPSGTMLDSFLLHVDPILSTRKLEGQITFNQPILGIILSPATQGQGDNLFGAPETAYNQGPWTAGRRTGSMECSWDQITLSSDRKSIQVRMFAAGDFIDQVRILVQSAIIVGLDIKPGSGTNPVNLKSKGVLPVAILGSPAIDVLTLDQESLSLGGVSADRVSQEDANQDGHDDLVAKFSVKELLADGALNETTTTLTLEGATLDGLPIIGIDTVTIVPKK